MKRKYSHRVRHRWVVYPPNYSSSRGNFVEAYSRNQMLKALFKFGTGATTMYDPVVHHKDGSISFGSALDKVTQKREDSENLILTDFRLDQY